MIGIGLLGAGRIGRLHAGTIQSSAALQLKAVFDSDRAAAERLAGGATVAGSADEVIAHDRVDAVMVCSPTDTHVDLASRAIRAGKAVFCEKPLDLDLARASVLLDLLRERPVPFMTGFHRRFDPSTRRLREHVAAGGIGRPEFMRVLSRDPAPPPLDYVRRSGGIFRDMTIHDLDLCRWLTGTEFVGVQARGWCLVDPAIQEAGDVDTATVTMWAEDGFHVTIQNSRRSNAGFDQRIEIMGSTGAVALDNVPMTRARFLDPGGERADRLPDHFPERYREAYVSQLDHFAQAVASGAPPMTSALDGVAALQLADACARALATGEAVVVRPVARALAPDVARPPSDLREAKPARGAA